MQAGHIYPGAWAGFKIARPVGDVKRHSMNIQHAYSMPLFTSCLWLAAWPTTQAGQSQPQARDCRLGSWRQLCCMGPAIGEQVSSTEACDIAGGERYLGEFMSVNCSWEIPTAAMRENMTQNSPAGQEKVRLLVSVAADQIVPLDWCTDRPGKYGVRGLHMCCCNTGCSRLMWRATCHVSKMG